MSYINPTIPTLTLKGLDTKIQDIQASLATDLTWLDKSFGLADRIVEQKDRKNYIYPAVFESNVKDPIPMLPGDAWGAFSFWVKNGPASIEGGESRPKKNPIITYNVSCIFYVDIRKIDNATNYKQTKSDLIEDIFNFFNTLHFKGQINMTRFIDDDIVKIWDGYSLEGLDQFILYPKWACRLDFEISFRWNYCSLSAYWATREPNYLLLTVLSDTSIKVDWIDGSLAADGLKVYFNDVLKATVAFGVETATITGLTANTEYTVKVVAYSGSNESDPITATETTFEVWYLAGSVPAANAKAAYSPEGAASLAASYINLANPGTNNAAPGSAPTWDVVLGWIFDGVAQYLLTGITPPSNNTCSMIVKFSEWTTGTDTVAGTYTSGTKEFLIQIDSVTNKVYGGNGAALGVAPAISKGIVSVSGNKIYINGNVQAGTIGAGTGGAHSYQIAIGCVNYSAPTGFFDGNVQKVAIYDLVLSALQNARITDRMDIYGVDRINYVRREFGALICWNMPMFFNYTTSEMADPNLDPDTFNPSGLDIDEWLDACVAAGMKYAILTAKHHDGFCLWPSTYSSGLYTPYSIAQSAWYAANGNTDIVGEFVTKAKARNLKVGIYFSILDTTFETKTSSDQTTNAAGYIAMIEGQLNELLSNYETIDSIWTDGWQWHIGYANIPYATIFDYIKSIQANCTLVENAHTFPSVTSQIQTYEVPIDDVIPEGNLLLSEEINTIRNDGHWFFHPDDTVGADKHYTKTQINAARAQANGRYGSYLMGITPDTTGHLPAAQKALLESLTT